MKDKQFAAAASFDMIFLSSFALCNYVDFSRVRNKKGCKASTSLSKSWFSCFYLSFFLALDKCFSVSAPIDLYPHTCESVETKSVLQIFTKVQDEIKKKEFNKSLCNVSDTRRCCALLFFTLQHFSLSEKVIHELMIPEITYANYYDFSNFLNSILQF